MGREIQTPLVAFRLLETCVEYAFLSVYKHDFIEIEMSKCGKLSIEIAVTLVSV